MWRYKKYIIYLRTVKMKRRFILLIILVIAFLSMMSFVSLLLYFDPYISIRLSLTLLAISFIGSLWWIMTLLLYFIKKIYYRWEVWMYHIISSMRQSFFLCIWILWIVWMNFLDLPLLLPALLLWIGLIFLELFIKSF